MIGIHYISFIYINLCVYNTYLYKIICTWHLWYLMIINSNVFLTRFIPYKNPQKWCNRVPASPRPRDISEGWRSRPGNWCPRRWFSGTRSRPTTAANPSRRSDARTFVLGFWVKFPPLVEKKKKWNTEHDGNDRSWNMLGLGTPFSSRSVFSVLNPCTIAFWLRYARNWKHIIDRLGCPKKRDLTTFLEYDT